MQENIDPVNPINTQPTLSSSVTSEPPVATKMVGEQPAAPVPVTETSSTPPVLSTPPTPPTPTVSAPSTPPPPTSPGATGFPHFGLVLALFIGLVAILIGVAAYAMGLTDRLMLNPTPSPSPEVVVPSVSPVASPEAKICTMDAMICPDGSSVGRTGPNCEFVCPTTATPSASPAVKIVPPSASAGAGVMLNY